MSEIITRKQYMARYTNSPEGTALHHAYYSQFVTPQIRDLVKCHIGMDRLLASTDPHLNDIPLKEWDALHALALAYATPGMRKATGENNSYSVTCCILKCAARQLIDEAAL